MQTTITFLGLIVFTMANSALKISESFSTAINVSLIQGYPCVGGERNGNEDVNSNQGVVQVLGSEVSPWPLDCDQLCLKMINDNPTCASFTWSRLNSTCVFYSPCKRDDASSTPVSDSSLSQCCFQPSTHTFWFSRGSLVHRSNVDTSMYTRLTLANNYGEPECFANDDGQWMSWYRSRDICQSSGYELIAPESMADFVAKMTQFGEVDQYWTDFDADISSTLVTSFSSKYLIIFSTDNLITGSVDWAVDRRCLRYKTERGKSKLIIAFCDRNKGYICCRGKPLNFCENLLVPTRSRVFFSTQTTLGIENGFFLSQNSGCASKYGEEVDTDETTNMISNGLQFQTQDIVRAFGVFDYPLNLSADAAVLTMSEQLCLQFNQDNTTTVGTSSLCQNDVRAPTLCKTKYYASDKLVKYSDAESYCQLFGHSLVTMDDLKTDSLLLSFVQALGCDKTKIRLSLITDHVFDIESDGNINDYAIAALEASPDYSPFNYVVCKM